MMALMIPPGKPIVHILSVSRSILVPTVRAFRYHVCFEVQIKLIM